MRDPKIWLAVALLAAIAFVVGFLRGGGDRFATSPGAESVYDATYSALRVTPLADRAVVLAARFARADRSDLEDITRAFETTHIGTGPGAVEATLLGELWAQHDPAAALERVSAWRPFWVRQMLAPLMRAWARLDLKAARERASAIEPEKNRSLAESSIALGRFAADGDAAWIGYTRDWPYGEAVLPEILSRIVHRDGLAGLFERIEALPADAPDDLRARALRHAAGLGGSLDPIATAAFVEAHADDPVEGLRNLRAPFVDAWAQTDAPAALEWLKSQPASGPRAAAIRVAFRPWILSAESRLEAIEWIEQQPEPVLASVRDLYAMALVRVDPQRAIEAAERIQGPNRENILRRVRQMIAIREKQANATSESAERQQRVRSQRAVSPAPSGAIDR